MSSSSAAFVLSVTPVKSSVRPSLLHSSNGTRKDGLYRAPPVRATLHQPLTPASTKNPISFLLTQLTSRAKEDTARVVDAFSTNSSIAQTALACFAALVVAAGAPGTSSMLMPVVPVLAEVPQTTPGPALLDEPNVINRGIEDSFEKIAKKIESRTGYKLHFILVRNLPFGRSAFDYAGDLAEQWQLGDKDLLFVASIKIDRAGVFVGDSVKNVLSDDVARSIAEQTFGIPAGEERYSTAILDVANRLIPVLNGEADPGAPDDSTKEVSQTYKTKEETKGNRDKYIKIVGGVLVIAIIAPLIQTYWYVRDD